MLTSKALSSTSSAAVATISTTMLPFLYQTRTLSGLLSTTQRSLRRIPPHRAIRRHLNTSARRPHAFDPENIPTTTAKEQSTSEDGGSQIRKVVYDFKPQSASNKRSIPERARDGGRHGGRRQSSRPLRSEVAEKSDLDDEVSMPHNIDFEEGIHEDTVRSGGEIDDWSDAYHPRESTITSKEKVAFQKIFSDIFRRSKIASPTLQTDDLDGSGPSDFLAGTGDRQKAKAALNNILTGAIQSQPKNRQDMERIISRYPPALREGAAKAMGFDTEEVELEDEESSQEALKLKAEELEALRAPERLRVESLMRAAKTDFELWEVMEEEVFSMIPKLGLEEKSKSKVPEGPKVDKKKKGWKKLLGQQQAEGHQKGPVQVGASGEDVDEETEGVSPLQLHGPLYPSYLLLGLRLLDRSFAKPSPLALSILPRIKSLGFISHVLGASTQFYNDLLRIYRYRYDDFRGMVDLMNEMEQSALDMDEETLSIVYDVMNMQASVRNLERGPAVRALWTMPEFAPRKFSSWRDKITTAINERKRDASSQVNY